MKALIDGDIILYAVGFASERRYYECSDGFMCTKAKEAKAHCAETEWEYTLQRDPSPSKVWKGNANAMLKSILEQTEASDHTLYFTGKGNFRETIYPEYKANRKGMDKPLCYKKLKEYLCDNYTCETVQGIEADDALGINQEEDTIICSLDKDLDMIPGWHYNWNKKEVFEINKADADLNFWLQVLTGDMTDNIVGLRGVGPKTAFKLLSACNHYDTPNYFTKCYFEYFKRDRIEDLETNCELLWIQRGTDSLWIDLLEEPNAPEV